VKLLLEVQIIVAAEYCALRLGAVEVAPVEVNTVVPSFLI
jgi:hypothetical protein